MARDDFYYPNVREALEKKGYEVTHSPLRLSIAKTVFKIDLSCELEGNKLAVEVKCFSGPSFVEEFHAAVGQCANYQVMLRKKDPDRTLYLAVPERVFKKRFSEFILELIDAQKINLVIFNESLNTVVQWRQFTK